MFFGDDNVACTRVAEQVRTPLGPDSAQQRTDPTGGRVDFRQMLSIASGGEWSAQPRTVLRGACKVGGVLKAPLRRISQSSRCLNLSIWARPGALCLRACGLLSKSASKVSSPLTAHASAPLRLNGIRAPCPSPARHAFGHEQPFLGHRCSCGSGAEAVFMRRIILRSSSTSSGVTGTPAAVEPMARSPGRHSMGSLSCGTCGTSAANRGAAA